MDSKTWTLGDWTTFMEKAGINEKEFEIEYAQIFVNERIDESSLIYFTRDEREAHNQLEKKGVKLGHRIKIIDYIKNEYSTEKSKKTVGTMIDSSTEENSKQLPKTPSPPDTPPKKRSKVEEFEEYVKNFEVLGTDAANLAIRATSIIKGLEDNNSLLEKQISIIEWPNKIRGAVFDIEGETDLSTWTVCFQCGSVHTPTCSYNKDTAKCSNEGKVKRIFIRRQRWYHLLMSVFRNPDFVNNPRVKKIVIRLKTMFDQIRKASNTDGLSEAEIFIHGLTNFESMVHWFCQAVADIFEELSQLSKNVGGTGGIANMGIFTPPYDMFATVLMNSVVIFNAHGTVTVTPFAPVFVPQEKNI